MDAARCPSPSYFAARAINRAQAQEALSCRNLRGTRRLQNGAHRPGEIAGESGTQLIFSMLFKWLGIGNDRRKEAIKSLEKIKGTILAKVNVGNRDFLATTLALPAFRIGATSGLYLKALPRFFK